MHIFKEIAPLRAYLSERHSTPFSIGFVPTMGALHEGHLSLVRASKNENAITLCSIYINPTQFGNREDLDKYPRTLDEDFAKLKAEDCDAVFCPENAEMYGQSGPLNFDFGHLNKILEGEFRPGHFSGVALVVAKLFNIVQPDRAYFGQKDFQQVAIITRLVEALKFNVQLVCMPIVREADGLAMSSRNQRLTADERKQATVLYRCLQQARDGFLQGKQLSTLREEARRQCAESSVMLEYLALADRKELVLMDKVGAPGNAILLIAAKLGPVRLIDNLLLES